MNQADCNQKNASSDPIDYDLCSDGFALDEMANIVNQRATNVLKESIDFLKTPSAKKQRKSREMQFMKYLYNKIKPLYSAIMNINIVIDLKTEIINNFAKKLAERLRKAANNDFCCWFSQHTASSIEIYVIPIVTILDKLTDIKNLEYLYKYLEECSQNNLKLIEFMQGIQKSDLYLKNTEQDFRETIDIALDSFIYVSSKLDQKTKEINLYQQIKIKNDKSYNIIKNFLNPPVH